MYHYQRKLTEEAAKYMPQSKTVEAKQEKVVVDETAPLSIDEMLKLLTDKTPQMVVPVNEFFGLFKKKLSTNEQVLLTSFSSVVLPRLAIKITQNSNNPSKVLDILKTECTQKEKDLIARLASEIIPELAKKYSDTPTMRSYKFESLSGSAPYYQKKLYEEIKQINERIFGFGGKEVAVPDFYKQPPVGWRAITIEEPTGPGVPAIEKAIPGIGKILVIFSEGGVKKTFFGYRQKWGVYGDLSFIPDALCRKAVDPTNPEQIQKAFINLRDWHEIVKGFTQAHDLVMKGKA